jgi:hypothetical protein
VLALAPWAARKQIGLFLLMGMHRQINDLVVLRNLWLILIIKSGVFQDVVKQTFFSILRWVQVKQRIYFPLVSALLPT